MHDYAFILKYICEKNKIHFCRFLLKYQRKESFKLIFKFNQQSKYGKTSFKIINFSSLEFCLDCYESNTDLKKLIVYICRFTDGVTKDDERMLLDMLFSIKK
jgi:hypothetical protein